MYMLSSIPRKRSLAMADESARDPGQDALLRELEGIRDVYRSDVKQFVAFLRSHELHIVDGFRQYAAWLEEEHAGKRYSPSTVNRKLAAAKSRVRYAFKHSAFAADLRRKYQLEEILKSVKLKKIDVVSVRSGRVLDIEEARRLVGDAKDRTIRLMVTLLVRTGVRVSEMLGLKLSDIGTAKGRLVPLKVVGKGGRERTIHIEKDFLDRVRKHFAGGTWLFEHKARPYSRVSVTNRIKHESLRILGREVSAQQLRHTWAAIQINRGRAVSAVAAAMGHSNAGLTAQLNDQGTLKPKEALLDLGTSEGDGAPGAKGHGRGSRGSSPSGKEPA
jgi:integrase